MFRIAYGMAYMLNLATLRSLIWSGGMVCVLGLYFAAAKAA